MKTNLPIFLRTAAFLAVALAAGCDTTEVRHPKTTQVVVFVRDQAVPDVALGLVSAVQVVLPGPDAGSGLSWEIISNNNLILEQMGPLKTTTGATTTTTVSFYALKPGKSVLRFFLLNPRDQEAVPVAKCEVTVRVRE
ncbi:MAG TPA: hypothetical protein VII43_06340 [Opitutaceae bacterium]